MTEVFVTDPSNRGPKNPSAARRGAAVFATLAGLAMLASPIHGAFGATEVRNDDDPGRIPYQSVVQQGTAGQLFKFGFPAVPAGHRLVIQHISGGLLFQAPPSHSAQVEVTVNGQIAASFFAPFILTSVKFDQPVQLYVDAGEVPTVVVEGDNGLVPAVRGSLILTGYLLDCTAAPCAPIAQ